MKPKDASVAGIIIKSRTPDENKAKSEDDSDDPSAAIESCAEELIRAVHARDTKAVSAALKDAFDILESMPHEEEENESSEPSPHSYDSQNQKAAKGEE